MLIEFIRLCLGAIHEFAPDFLVPWIDAFFPCVIIIILLVFICTVSVTVAKTVVKCLWSGVR